MNIQLIHYGNYQMQFDTTTSELNPTDGSCTVVCETCLTITLPQCLLNHCIFNFSSLFLFTLLYLACLQER